MMSKTISYTAGIVVALFWIGLSAVSYGTANGEEKSTKCQEIKEPNIEDSTEIRWFFKGPLPEQVKTWFITSPNQDRLGKPKEPEEPREDLYLLASGGPRVGVKLREGKVEVKLLEESQAMVAKDGAIVGRGETWLKWGWRYTCEKELAGSNLDHKIASGISKWNDQALQVNVVKRRTERRFRSQPDGTFEPVDKRLESGESGAKAEVTELEVGKNKDKWWTIEAEVVGKAELPFDSLRKGLAWVLKEYPADHRLTKDASMSYPEWAEEFVRKK